MDVVKLTTQIVDSPPHVHHVHILLPPPLTKPGATWSTVNDEGRKCHAHDAMAETLKSILDLHLDISVGGPGTTISNIAEEMKVDLIVFPSHIRSGMRHILPKSVA